MHWKGENKAIYNSQNYVHVEIYCIILAISGPMLLVLVILWVVNIKLL